MYQKTNTHSPTAVIQKNLFKKNPQIHLDLKNYVFVLSLSNFKVNIHKLMYSSTFD